MAGTKDESLAERNRRICMYRRNGFTYSEIGDLEGLSRARVAQIVAETTPELPEEDSRAEIASLLEYAERKCVDLIEHPGFMCGPTGRVVEDPDGNPMPNKSVMVDALKTVILVAEKRSRLYGTDKPVQGTMRADLAQEEARAFLASVKARMEVSDAASREIEALRRENEALRRQSGQVIPGEIVAELPPGSA